MQTVKYFYKLITHENLYNYETKTKQINFDYPTIDYLCMTILSINKYKSIKKLKLKIELEN